MADENEKLLILARNGDEDAKTSLINQNYPLIKSVIKRYKNKGIDYDDLFQLGCVGFVKAINNFNTGFGVKFSTYAVPMIAGEVKRFLRDDGSLKVSRALKALSIQIKKFVDEKSQKGEDLSLEEIAKHFNVDTQEVVFAMDANLRPVSLSTKIDDDEDGLSLEDCIQSPETDESMLDHIILKSLIKNLDEKERKVIIMRYYRDKTQSEIASILGVSQVQVSRIEQKVLERFKKEFKSKK